MISLNYYKFLFFILLIVVFSNGCSVFNKNTADDDSNLNASEVQTTIPFETKEPATFQTEVIVSNYIGNKETKRSYFIAKKDNKAIIVFGFGSENEKAKLKTDEHTIYWIDHKENTAKKIIGRKPSVSDNDLKNFITNKLLNEKVSAEFEKLETVNNLTKYSVRLDESEKAEAIIFIDEKLKLPVKQEFFSIANGKSLLTYSINLENFKTNVADDVFEIPSNYKTIE